MTTTIPLVETKFFRPAPRAGAVPRPALIGRLSGGAPVVLVSAPAGFGETTLLSRWLAGADAPRTHTRNIYAKLGVTSRRAAVRRAHELKLL